MKIINRLEKMGISLRCGSTCSWVFLGLIASCAPPRALVAPGPQPMTPGPELMPDQLHDSWEPVNRGVWAFNERMLKYVVAPASRGYREVVPQRVRRSIHDFGYNITYPGRLVNEMLQARWGDAGQDSLRFVTNLTAGGLGFFDPASHWKISKPSASFSQTFAGWGWQPHQFLMLPLIGPSDEMHAVGFGMDRAADPLSYNETTRWITYGSSFNDLSETAESTNRFIESDPDAYSTMRYLWTYASRGTQPDWSMKAPVDVPTLETLAVTALRLKNPKFPYWADESRVLIPATGKHLAFSCWMQKQPAPIVYLASGLGSHRMSMQALVLAEVLYANGFSVVSTSGLFHPEFMMNASTADVPGYSPSDARDLLGAVSAIDRQLERKHPGKIRSRALVGCSMGGYLTLMLAKDQQKCGSDVVKIDRYVAINPPVNLHHGLDVLDRYQLAPLQWPESERQQRINNTILKVSNLALKPQAIEGIPPFDGVESKYLIGLTFRLTLRNTIFNSQMRRDMGLLKKPLSVWNRDAVYNEILCLSFRDYFDGFAVPYFAERGIKAADFVRYGDLKRCGGSLQGARNTFVVTSSNDFLLAPDDVAWLRGTFGPSRLRMFDHGGHLGGLGADPFQHEIVGFLNGLKGH